MRSPSFALVTSLVALAACEGSHSDLGQDTTTSTTGAGGAAAGGGGATGGFNTGGAPQITEPDGPPALTVLHAIADRPAMQLCLLASPDDSGDDAAPWPSEPLVFAQPAVAPPLPAASDVSILVLTGDLDAIGGALCRDIRDDPTGFSGLEVLSLGIVTEADLSAPRSILLAITGCFGGEGHDGDALDLVCGPGYAPDAPTPGAIVAPLSRYPNIENIGFQAVNATSAGALIDVYGQSSFDGTPELTIATLVPPGGAAPFPPSTVFSAAELGMPRIASVRAQSDATGDSTTVLLGDAIDHGGISTEVFANGRNVALVAVGPAPGAPSASWHEDFTVVALDSDPIE